ncbi:WD40 repeat domain-containing protein [Cytophaga aurantiaca]|uniref:WD40 repeat domain-containing protein n=1 Tax=Cytophaga aurantiaca TaxID=29530 RepID=UPI00037BA364|nr:WD40 repeat domain-containing protein [Cytophaga aurantiaca]
MKQAIHVQKLGVYKGHNDSIYALEAGVSEAAFYTSGADGMVVAWDLNKPDEGKLVAKLPNSVYALCYVPETHELFVGHNFEGVHVIDTNTNKEKKSAQITKSAIFDIKKYRDWLLVATGDGYLIVLESSDLSTIAKLKITDASIRVLAIDPNQKQLAIGCSDHLVRIIDLPSLRITHTLKGHTNSVFTLTYSPDGEVLLSAGRDAHIIVWDMRTYTPIHSIAAHMYAINHIAFSASGKYFVTVSMDKSIKVWDAAQFKLLKVIDKSRHAGHATSVNKVLWTAFNHSIISVSDDRTISIWNVDVPHGLI